MSTSPQPSGISPEAQAHLEKFFAHMERLGEFVGQVFQARQGFYEKLMILNGATLTLLFSAMTGFGATASPVHRAELYSRLLSGCWMLVASIICCLLHNFINIAYFVHSSAHILLGNMHNTRVRFYSALKRGGFVSDEPDLPPESPEANKSEKNATRTERFCRWIGVVAQGLTIAAYITFIRSLAAFAAMR